MPRQRIEPRPRRHLKVPEQPRPAPYRTTSIATVQHRVPSPLAFVTIEHLVAGVVPAAVFTDSSDPGPRLGLLVVADGFATVAMTAVLLIPVKPIASPWLLLAAIPRSSGPTSASGAE